MTRNKNRRRNKNTGHRAKQRVVARSGFVVTEHPFSRLPRAQVIDGLIEVGKTSQRNFAEKLAALEHACASIEPLQSIASLAAYGLFARLKANGEVSQSLGGGSINQSHVELLQALLLRAPVDALRRHSPTPDQIQQVFDLLPAVPESFHLRRLAEDRGPRLSSMVGRGDDYS